MTTRAAVERGFTPELRATIFYFVQYMAGAATTVYGGIWLAEKGLSAAEIGILNAVPTLIMILLNVAVGRLADKASDWRTVIVIASVLAGVLPIALFWAEGFWAITIVWTLLTLPAAALGPVIDAATMRMTRRRGTKFGPIRAWGTVGYMVMLLVVGMIITWLGGAIFLPMFVALSLVRTFAAFQLPRFRGPESSVQPPSPAGAASRLKDAMKPFFILPLVGWSMVTSIHAVLNAFQGLLWKQQGFGADIIAPLLAIAAIAEAGLMFCFAPIVKRFSARSLILTSALVAVFRWVCMALQPGLEVLIVLQGLNAITFALGYMGCLHFIANWTSDDIAAEAQGFFQMLQQGMCVISLAAFGWLMELMGARAYFVAAGFSMLGAGLIYLSMRMHARKQVTDSKLA